MKKELTIINVCEMNFFDVPAGVGRLVLDLCRKQVEWGHRTYMMSWKVRPDREDREERDGMTIIRISGKAYQPPDPRNLYAKVRTYRREVRKLIGEAGPVDVIHSHAPMQGLGALGAVNAGALKVHSIHSPWIREMEAARKWEGVGDLKSRLAKKAAMVAARRLEAACFGLADVITSDSAFTKGVITQEYARTTGTKRFEVYSGWVDTVRFCPDGPTTDWVAELGRPPRGPVFFTVRGLRPRNGIEMLIEAAAVVRDKGYVFEVVIGGMGPLLETLREKIREKNLGDRVTLLGPVDDDRLPVLYRSGDMFVLPTLELECFGLIILEAFASGKPVIATPVGAIPELMTPIFPDGLLTETSSRALAGTMIRFLEKEGTMAGGDELGARLRNFAVERYNVDLCTGRFLKLYESGAGPAPAK